MSLSFRHSIAVPALAALAGLTGTPAWSQVTIRQTPQGVEVGLPVNADGSWSLPWNLEQVAAIARGKTLRIRGVVGTVRVVKSAHEDLATLKVTRTEGEPRPRVVVMPEPQGVTVCAIYPSPDTNKPNECLADGKGRLAEGLRKDWPAVAFEVGIPNGTNLAVELTNGDIKADIAPGIEATLRTGKGRIDVADYGAGTLRADVRDGHVTAAVAAMPKVTGRHLILSVVGGSIWVQVPTSMPLAYSIDGRLHSPFALQPRGSETYQGHLGPEEPERLSLRLSAGILGSIRLEPLPPDRGAR